MSQHDFETSVRAARELSEDELMQIQGGGFFGDVWDGVKTVGQAIWDGIKVIFNPPPRPRPLPDPFPLPRPDPYPLPHPRPRPF